jgi:hypothetical protein
MTLGPDGTRTDLWGDGTQTDLWGDGTRTDDTRTGSPTNYQLAIGYNFYHFFGLKYQKIRKISRKSKIIF